MAHSRRLHHAFSLTLLFVFALAPYSQAADTAAPEPATAAADGASPGDASETLSQWYWFHGSTNSHPRLDKADREIERELNTPFRLIAPGFDDVKTFSDQADDFMIWAPFAGVGRKFGNHWDVFFQVGGSAGSVHTESDDTSLLLLPWHADVVIKRSNLFIGPGVAWYPFGFAVNKPKMTWGERINGTRPYLLATLSWNRLTYSADIKAGLKPFPNFVRNKRKESYHPFSSNLGAGIDLPLSDRNTLSLNAQYGMMFDYGEDFNGYNFAIFMKHAFGKSKK